MSQVPDEQPVFEHDIYLYPPYGKSFKNLESGQRSRHRVLLDTQCTVGNWISEHLVSRLGMEAEMRCVDPPDGRDFNGQLVVANGMISFQWSHPEGTTVHELVDFFVGRRHDIDMIFGSHYIQKMGLLDFNKGRMLPIMPYRQKIRASEHAKIAAMEQSQREGMEKVEAFQQSHEPQSQYPAAPYESYSRSAEGSCPSALQPQNASHSASQQGFLSNHRTDYTSQRSQGYEELPASQNCSQAQSPISPYQSSGQPYTSQGAETRSYSTDPGRFDEFGSREPPYPGAQERSAGIREPPSSHRDPYSRAHDAYTIARDPYPDTRDPPSDTRKPNPDSRDKRRGKR